MIGDDSCSRYTILSLERAASSCRSSPLGFLYAILIADHASAARVVGKYECQQPFTTGEFAVDG